MLKTAPTPVDVLEFQFKLRCRLQLFENTDAASFSQPCNLVACASRFGLVFTGTNSPNFQVIQLKHLEDYSTNDNYKADYPRRTVALPSLPKHLSVNCEHSILAVVVEKNGSPWALFYMVKSFWTQNLSQVGEVRLSATPGVHVTEINWNPALGGVFTACKSDGTLGIYEIKDSGIDINELPAAAGATCFCWSPKGKQIAVGSRDGKITQYKPDLKAVKVINAPPLKEPHSLISLQWVSNYQFIGVYQSASPDNQNCVIAVDAPKTGEPTYLNYDDICYSNGSVRPNQFYMILQQNWNVLMVASSNSSEVGILANSGECWTQWIMADAARAELPLGSGHQETLPVGIGLDIGSTQPVPWGETTIPPCPFLLVLSHHGTLCCFNIVNLKQGAPSICTPPDPISDTSGLQQFVAKVEQPKTQLAQPTIQAQLKIPTPAPPTAVAEIKTTPPTSKPLSFSTTQASNLFGGQATLIPVSQTSKSNLPTTQLYPSLPYQALYPSLPGDVPKTAPLQVTPTPQPKPQSQPGTTTPKSVQPKPTEETSKTEIPNVDLKAEEENEALLAQMVKEECVYLESELKAVLHQGKTLKLDLGTEQEKIQLVDCTKFLIDFFKELTDLCKTQSAEVHVLKQNLLQSWAWYEEVKSRHVASKNESIEILLRAQPLDSASEKQLEDIRHTNYYLESQIAQAHRALDEQWDSFQDYCKKTHKMQIPTMEMIFQTMVKQNAILRKQSYVLKDIASRIKSKSRSALGPSLLVVDETGDLPDELKRLRLNPEDICQIQYERVVNRTKNFTKKKTETLRNFLKKRERPHISAVKPQLASSIIQASPAMKLKQLSALLETKSSPKKLDFVQSTPKPVVVKFETTQAPTPIEGLQNFALKFEAKNFTKPALTKSGIASSPNSAFVSTSFGAVSTSSTTSMSSFKPVVFGTSVTTTPSFVKPSQAVTAIAPANQPVVGVTKSFSFTNTSVFSQTAAAKPAFAAPSTAKSTFSFTLPTTSVVKAVTTAAPVLVKADTKIAAAATKTSTIVTSSLSLATSTKSVTAADSTTKTTAAASLPFGAAASSTVTTTAPFSLSTGSSIFGGTSEKTSEATTSTSKPFIFVSVGGAKTSAVTLTSTSTSTSVTAVSTSNQSFSLITPVTSPANVTKTSTVELPAGVTLTPIAKVVPTTTTTPSAISTSTTKPSLFGNLAVVSTQQTSILSSTVATTTVTKPSIFGVQPFSSITSIAATTTESKTPATSTTVSAGSTPVNLVTGTSQQSIFGSSATTTPQTATSASFVFGGTPSTKPSVIFGNADSTAKTSIFGSTLSSTPATVASVFVSTPTSTPATAGFEASDLTAKSPIFGSTSTSTAATVGFGASDLTAKPAIFGSTPSSTPATVGFGASNLTTKPSVFGSTPTSTPTTVGFGTSDLTAKPSVFGSTPTSTPTSVGFGASDLAAKSSVFGSTPTSTPTTVGFGASDLTSKSSGFGSTASSTPSTVFGAATAPQSPTFGTTTNQTSVFGSPTTTTQSVFGSVPTSSATQSQGFGVFGDATQKTSIFGAAASTNAITQSSVFGGSTQTPIFGGTTTTASSTFGQNSSVFDSTKSTQSIFGQSSGFGSGSTFGSTSVFGGSAPSFGQSSGSIFGSTATTSSGGIFGGTPTTSSGFGSSSVFGAPASSTNTMFGSSGGFATTATQPSTFGASAGSASFGFGGLNVGSTPTTSSAFGATPPNPFGVSENKSVFGSPSTSSNTGFGSTSGSIFGNASQSFGGGTFGGGQSVFGQQSTFGQSSSFGNSTFGQQSPGPFSGGQSVAQSGFGGSPAFQKPGGFGGSPVFGSSPSFGSAPSFGGAPAFGSSPTFGSTSKVFGTGSTGFAAATNTQNTAFGNLANQPTVGFGNLAQQASNPSSQNTAFSGNSSFSSWR